MKLADLVGKKVVRTYCEEKYHGNWIVWSLVFDDETWIRFEGELGEVSMEMGGENKVGGKK